MVAIIGFDGLTIQDCKILNAKPDKHGLVQVELPNGTVSHVDKKRVLASNISASIASMSGKHAVCPVCKEICLIKSGCALHGRINVLNSVEHQEQNKNELINIDDLYSITESWVSVRDTVVAVCMIFGDQYIRFNIYDGSCGKDDKLPWERFKDGSYKSYQVKDVVKLRAKLSKDGYSSREPALCNV